MGAVREPPSYWIQMEADTTTRPLSCTHLLYHKWIPAFAGMTSRKGFPLVFVEKPIAPPAKTDSL
jgi:hypothetical protein